MKRLSRALRSLGAALPLVIAFVAATSFVPRAQAHPLVDDGVENADQALFEGALAAFDRAWSSNDLRREDVITLLAHRAIVHFALRDEVALDRDLLFLATLAPDYRFAPHVPPPIRERFDRTRRGASSIAISVTATFDRSGTRLDVELRGAPEGLARDVRVNARVPGGAWVESYGTHIELPFDEVESIEWYAELLGPGGAVIAAEGSDVTPRRSVNRQSLERPASVPFEDATPSRRSWRWWAIGGGAAAVVITAIAIAVARDPATLTYVSAPEVR